MLAMDAYAHFDEWWGPFAGSGVETMGEAMTRLSDTGELRVLEPRDQPDERATSSSDTPRHAPPPSLHTF